MASPGTNPTGVNTASVQGGSLLISAIPIGPIALASIGANTTDAIQLFLTEIFVPCNRFATKIGILQGGTAGTDSIIGVIYDSTGALVGSTTLAGTALNSSANTFLEMSIIRDSAGVLVTGVQLFGPGQYFVGCQGNGTAAGAIQTTRRRISCRATALPPPCSQRCRQPSRCPQPLLLARVRSPTSNKESEMTLDEFLEKFFAPEYLNVQDKEAFKAQAKAELEKLLAQWAKQ
jgi:hypothetical protein